MRIGFIGVGLMGGPLARNLIRAGKTVLVYDLSREAVEKTLAAGTTGQAAASTKALADCDLVFTSLPMPNHVKGVMLGADGCYGFMKKGATHVELSTIDPMTAKELEEAAKMDGCGHLRIFAMVLRLNSSALTAMGVLVLLFAWNDLLWPTMVTTSTDKRVLSVFIALTQSGFGNEYGYLMAAGVLAILPLIIIYLICQRAFMTSIAMSGIKD